MQSQTTAGVIAPPPAIAGAAFVAAWIMEWFFIRLHLHLPAGLRVIAACVLVVIGCLSAADAMWRFHKADTPVEPWHPTTALVTDGIYRRTRNPIYLGMVLVLAASALAFDSLWSLLAVPALVIVFNRYVIAREETYLAKLFGRPYQLYCQQVRRWL